MGESKRRKILDPNYGKKTQVKKQSNSQEAEISKKFNYQLLEEEKNLDDEDNSLIRLAVKFEYEAQGKTSDGVEISDSGKTEFVRNFDEDYYDDDGIIFGEAFQSVMNHFYSFAFEKQGHREVSEVTISIFNLRVENPAAN